MPTNFGKCVQDLFREALERQLEEQGSPQEPIGAILDGTEEPSYGTVHAIAEVLSLSGAQVDKIYRALSADARVMMGVSKNS